MLLVESSVRRKGGNGAEFIMNDFRTSVMKGVSVDPTLAFVVCKCLQLESPKALEPHGPIGRMCSSSEDVPCFGRSANAFSELVMSWISSSHHALKKQAMLTRCVLSAESTRV
jgi:hypothetical protein